MFQPVQVPFLEQQLKNAYTGSLDGQTKEALRKIDPSSSSSDAHMKQRIMETSSMVHPKQQVKGQPYPRHRSGRAEFSLTVLPFAVWRLLSHVQPSSMKALSSRIRFPRQRPTLEVPLSTHFFLNRDRERPSCLNEVLNNTHKYSGRL